MVTNSSMLDFSLTSGHLPLSVKYEFEPEVYPYFGENMTISEVAEEYWVRWHGRRVVPMEVTVAICICGTILNTVNILVFSRKSMLNSISILLMAFETANIIIFLTFVLQSVDYFASRNFIFTFCWVFILRLYPYLRLVGAFSLSWFAASVGVWRCIAVASTIKASKWLTKSRAYKLVIGIFLLSFLFAIQGLFIASYHREVKIDELTGDNFVIHRLIPWKVYYKNRLPIVTVIIIISAVIPAIILVASTCYLIRSLYRASGLRKKLSFRSTTQPRETEPENVEKSVSVMMLAVLLLFLLNWLPYCIGAVIFFLFKEKYRLGLIMWSPHKAIQYILMDDTYPLINNTCTFFVYYNMSANFRRVFWRFFIKKKPLAINTLSQSSLRSKV